MFYFFLPFLETFDHKCSLLYATSTFVEVQNHFMPVQVHFYSCFYLQTNEPIIKQTLGKHNILEVIEMNKLWQGMKSSNITQMT